jgi:putative DeoR family transcriptional regulator (stage III sporulation protein D)
MKTLLRHPTKAAPIIGKTSLISHFSLLTSNLGRASGVHDYIKERTIKIGKYIVETRKTVRVIAKEFGVSKSTVHKDLTERLPEINPELAQEVKQILDYHKSIRHLRGGEATKKKYKKQAVKNN